MRQTTLIGSLLVFAATLVWVGGRTQAHAQSGPDVSKDFAVVAKVLQHPRCQNCHIPGDAPLQFDEGTPHAQNVRRGPKGDGSLGLSCATCHGVRNPPDSYGSRMPPGAPNWKLPPPEEKMVFIGLAPADLCRRLKDPAQNGRRDLEKLYQHIDKDKLVLWGWNPGVGRAPVDVPHAEFSAAFRRWIDAGAPCSSQELRSEPAHAPASGSP